MNRSQRRAVGKKGPTMPTREGSTPLRDAGTMRMPLENPEPCGDISIAEAAEIKARVEMATKLEKEANEFAEKLNNTNMLRRIIENERQHFMRKLIEAHGLDGADEYRVNPEDGRILRVAKGVPMSEEAPEEAPVEALAEAIPEAE